jgi:tight adherence protein B
MGATPTEALDVFRHNEAVPELAFVSVALDVQHQSGGSIAPVLESATDSVSSELDLMRSLRVQTAQAKLSAGIVTVMPFVLVALFSLMSPGFLSPFFESFVGFLLLAVALLMQAAGVLCVRHMLKINGG